MNDEVKAKRPAPYFKWNFHKKQAEKTGNLPPWLYMSIPWYGPREVGRSDKETNQ